MDTDIRYTFGYGTNFYKFASALEEICGSYATVLVCSEGIGT